MSRRIRTEMISRSVCSSCRQTGSPSASWHAKKFPSWVCFSSDFGHSKRMKDIDNELPRWCPKLFEHAVALGKSDA